MILKDFSKILLNNPDKSSVKLLYEWLKDILKRKPKNNVEKIIKKELYSAENELGNFLIIAKRESGRKLIKVLYNFAMSFEHQKLARKIHEVKNVKQVKDRKTENK